jgi:hypothetical protein
MPNVNLSYYKNSFKDAEYRLKDIVESIAMVGHDRDEIIHFVDTMEENFDSLIEIITRHNETLTPNTRRFEDIEHGV